MIERLNQGISLEEIYGAIVRYRDLMSKVVFSEGNINGVEKVPPPDFLDSLQFVRHTMLSVVGKKLTAEEIMILARMNADEEMYKNNKDHE